MTDIHTSGEPGVFWEAVRGFDEEVLAGGTGKEARFERGGR